MRAGLIALGWSVLACLAGCTADPLAQMPSFPDHRGDRIGMLPVSVNSRYADDALPLSAIRDAVELGVGTALGTTVQAVSQQAQRAPADAFPYTPGRLQAANRQLAFEGLVGVSVSNWVPPLKGVKNGDARLELLVAFADRDGHRWIFSAAWSAPDLDSMKVQIAQSLPTLLESAYRDGSASASLSATGAKGGAAVTLVARQPLRESGNISDEKALDVLVTVVDDRGITAVDVSNPTRRFVRTLPADPNEQGERPIFLSAVVHVPLEQGVNGVQVTATSATADKQGTPVQVQRTVQIDSSAQHPVLLLSIAPGADRAGAATVASMRALETSGMLDVIKVLASPVLRSSVEAGLGAAEERSADGDTAVIHVSARAIDDGGAVYFDQVVGNPDAVSSRAPRGRLTLEDIAQGAADANRLLVLDLCAEPAALTQVRAAVDAALATVPWALARVEHCDAGFGALGPRLTATLLGKPEPTAEALFGELARAATNAMPGQLYAGFNGRGGLALAGPRAKSDPDPRLVQQVANEAQGLAATLDRDGHGGTSVGSLESEFFIVSYSSAHVADAQRRADQLRGQGIASGVVKGVSGNYGVVVGQFEDVKSATTLLRRMKASRQVPDDAYILPPTRVENVVTEIQH